MHRYIPKIRNRSILTKLHPVVSHIQFPLPAKTVVTRPAHRSEVKVSPWAARFCAQPGAHKHVLSYLVHGALPASHEVRRFIASEPTSNPGTRYGFPVDKNPSCTFKVPELGVQSEPGVSRNELSASHKNMPARHRPLQEIPISALYGRSDYSVFRTPCSRAPFGLFKLFSVSHCSLSRTARPTPINCRGSNCTIFQLDAIFDSRSCTPLVQCM